MPLSTKGVHITEVLFTLGRIPCHIHPRGTDVHMDSGKEPLYFTFRDEALDPELFSKPAAEKKATSKCRS
jgi:hypothetical protein